MTRSDRIGEIQYDTEIEKTAKRLRKETKLRKQASSSKSVQEEEMAQENRTLRELAAPTDNQ